MADKPAAERTEQPTPERLRKARQELRSELVELAVRKAEERIRENITDNDQRLLVEEYITNLKEGSAAA